MSFRYLYQHVSFDYCLIASFICSNIQYPELFFPTYNTSVSQCLSTTILIFSGIKQSQLLIHISNTIISWFLCPVLSNLGLYPVPSSLCSCILFKHLAVLISDSLIYFSAFLPLVLSLFCISVPRLLVPVPRTIISLFLYLKLSSLGYCIQTCTCFKFSHLLVFVSGSIFSSFIQYHF
jgi:hypothetical protein